MLISLARWFWSHECLEKFDQAITDYSAGLVLKTELLPLSSRQIAEAHYKLSIVLDLTSGRLSDAITHAETALESVLARISEIKGSLGGKVTPISEPSEQNHKGKERLISLASVSSKLVQDMTPSQMQAELHDLESLKDDLAAKVGNGVNHTQTMLTSIHRSRN